MLDHRAATRGTKTGKPRPVFIVQKQALLDAGHPSTPIIPLTTRRIEEAGQNRP